MISMLGHVYHVVSFSTSEEVCVLFVFVWGGGGGRARACLCVPGGEVRGRDGEIDRAMCKPLSQYARHIGKPSILLGVFANSVLAHLQTAWMVGVVKEVSRKREGNDTREGGRKRRKGNEEGKKGKDKERKCARKKREKKRKHKIIRWCRYPSRHRWRYLQRALGAAH